MKTPLPWLAAAFILTGAAVSLRADPTNAPATSLDREQVREQLKNLTPEERRAKIEALRKERTWQLKPDQPAGRRPAGPAVGQPVRLPHSPDILTEDQRASLREAMEGEREQTRELEGKLRDARKAVFAAGLAEKFDENDVRAKALEIGRLEADLAVLRAKTFSKIKPPLSAGQIEIIKNAPPGLSGEGLRTFPLRQVPTRTVRLPAEPRDKHDLPLPPKPEK